MQLLHRLAPAIGEYLPVLQLEHWLDPAVGEYLPKLQFVHVLDVFEPKAEEYWPTAHLVQTDFPVRPL